MSKLNNTKKVLTTTLKVLLALLSYGFVGYRIYNSPDISSFQTFFNNLDINQWYILMLISVLMIINWSLEAIKWKNLIKPIQKVGFLKSLFAVWTGVTVGNITPNRIGEFAGRILFLEKKNRHKGTSITLYGDLAQFVVTLLFGIAGFSLLSQYLLSNTLGNNNNNTILIILTTGILLSVICSIIYYKIEKIMSLLARIKFLENAVSRFSFIDKIDSKLKSQTLILSILRYLVFTLQFYLALLFFEIEISYYHAIISISSIYLATHIVPNIPFAEIGIRVSFSLLFIGLFTDSNAFVLFSSLLIYVINIAIPSFGGGIYLLRRKTNN